MVFDLNSTSSNIFILIVSQQLLNKRQQVLNMIVKTPRNVFVLPNIAIKPAPPAPKIIRRTCSYSQKWVSGSIPPPSWQLRVSPASSSADWIPRTRSDLPVERLRLRRRQCRRVGSRNGIFDAFDAKYTLTLSH